MSADVDAVSVSEPALPAAGGLLLFGVVGSRA